MDNSNWMVYVSCRTYNQKHYIKDALDGFCVQQTTFPFVCGVIDDASTDGEPDVLRQYLAEHFDLEDTSEVRRDETDDYERVFARHKENRNCFFVVVFLKYNHYSINKTKLPYVSEWMDKSKYVALCEGDDYWIDSNKLQYQVKHMEEYQECGLCYGKARTYIEDKHKFGMIIGSHTQGFDDLLQQNKIPTLTTLLRKTVVDKAREMYEKQHFLMGDYPLWLAVSSISQIHFLDCLFAVYRVLPESAAHTKDYDRAKKFQLSINTIRTHFASLKDDPTVTDSIMDRNMIDLCNVAFFYKRCDDFVNYYSRIEGKIPFKLKVKRILCFFNK